MRLAAVLAILAAAVGLSACGGSGGGSDLSNSQEGDLTTCLTEAGFTEPKNFVATVEIDGTKRLTTVSFPPPLSEDDYVVVYEASGVAGAKKAAAAYEGGPFIEQVGSRLYTVAGVNDPLTAKQTQAIKSCLQS